GTPRGGHARLGGESSCAGADESQLAPVELQDGMLHSQTHGRAVRPAPLWAKKLIRPFARSILAVRQAAHDTALGRHPRLLGPSSTPAGLDNGKSKTLPLA